MALLSTGCDVLEFATNPAPRFEQTWNVPVDSTSISVAELLPADNSVQILPDSSAFTLSIGGASISRRVGSDCGQCNTLNGTNAPKPQFVLNAANSTSLPQSVVSAAILDGTISVQLTNGMSFDPLYVRTNPGPQTQGFMLIVIRSGSVVLGRDSVHGAASASADGISRPFPAGSVMTRLIDIGTGIAAGNLVVDVTLNSPLGDHNELIDANGTLSAVASVPSLTVASVSLNVSNSQLASSQNTVDLADLDESITDKVVRGTLEMTIDNPFAITGNVTVQFAYGPQPSDAVTKSVTMPTGLNQVRSVTLDSTDMSRILGKTIELTVGGSVNSTAPITVTPRQSIVIANRLILTIRTGGGN